MHTRTMHHTHTHTYKQQGRRLRACREAGASLPPPRVHVVDAVAAAVKILKPVLATGFATFWPPRRGPSGRRGSGRRPEGPRRGGQKVANPVIKTGFKIFRFGGGQHLCISFKLNHKSVNFPPIKPKSVNSFQIRQKSVNSKLNLNQPAL